jgi:hypothetical protein
MCSLAPIVPQQGHDKHLVSANTEILYYDSPQS